MSRTRKAWYFANEFYEIVVRKFVEVSDSRATLQDFHQLLFAGVFEKQPVDLFHFSAVLVHGCEYVLSYVFALESVVFMEVGELPKRKFGSPLEVLANAKESADREHIEEAECGR